MRKGNHGLYIVHVFAVGKNMKVAHVLLILRFYSRYTHVYRPYTILS